MFGPEYLIGWGLIWALIGGFVGSTKGQTVSGLVWCLLLGPIGLLILLFLPSRVGQQAAPAAYGGSAAGGRRTTCRSCGSAIFPDTKVCRVCDTPVEAAPAPVPSPAAPPVGAKFCTACGGGIPAGAKFCPGCGAAVSAA